ncbi:hypothetical protein COX95_02265 [bacterium CG_4_10_14_0_2_um_filter_33_32]|nr:MAG: hypothetical protein COU50_02105 [bacterium CG10_big_fil_rev_8_21_14_0_10_33_18]PIU76506.1 MAG: hypothetical protein COS74_03730 [bacterium CG06_land_8_20_14_3_00_33_50]PIY85762.1 MAG: hypothetical protein COY76_00505 [bacterium CG_4_10_14_0_8_um_filter_33_57]PIZ86061.1 MAG: hypothetical protein COX95_02265 [bacterium CG_4_10_14_0_2_um_filter_33_32]PJA71884.1 MAG: hypothetical protein CO152_04350 [bacterium CG_4_9_14_3_um_filter_33_26]
MTERDLKDIFIKLKKKIVNDFKGNINPSNLNCVKIQVSGFTNKLKSVYPYRGLKDIPAFYEHEERTILFNKDLVKLLDRDFIINILYHELLHASSFRKIDKHKDKTTVKSGFYTQIFKKGKKINYFKLLNEGVIQYFTNKKTGFVKDSGYQWEANRISFLIEDIGDSILEKLFFQGDIKGFEKIIHKNFNSTKILAILK